MLSLRGVSRRFGRALALDDVSLEVEGGSFVVLTGPNGAGKSTLLRIAATLDRPSRGSVRIGGFDPDAEGPKARRHVAYLAQDPGLYPDLTVRENLAFVAAFHARRDPVDVAVARALDAVGLAGKEDARARGLSRGERQRAALARATLAGDVMLLDEPTTALDADGAALVEGLLSSLRGERTLLVATHDRRIVERADRIVNLREGRIEAPEAMA